MNFDKHKEDLIRHCRCSLELLGKNDYHALREKWVVSSFLRNLGEQFNENDLVKVDGKIEFPDILFRDMRFEIKEKMQFGNMDENEDKVVCEVCGRQKNNGKNGSEDGLRVRVRERTKEYKNFLYCIENRIHSWSDLMNCKNKLSDIPRSAGISSEAMYGILWKECHNIMEKKKDNRHYSPEQRRMTDLLLYINPAGVAGFDNKGFVVPNNNLSQFGFRSVSFLYSRWSGIYMAADDASCLLKKHGVPFARMGTSDLDICEILDS